MSGLLARAARVCAASVACALLLLPAGAGAADGRAFWSAQCADCHGHVADFARERLRLIDGVLSARGVDGELRRFLADHHASDADADDVYTMLLAQAGAVPRFRNQCGSCHGDVADLARGALVRRDGALYGRRSQWRLDVFLPGHMGTGASDVPYFIELLDHAEREARR